MDLSYSAFKSEALRSALRKVELQSAENCKCATRTLILKPSDLVGEDGSRVHNLVQDCPEHGDPTNCDCNLVLSIPYGYFFPVDPTLELGDTKGPNSIYVRLVSNDKFRFIIKRKWLKNCLLLDSWFKDKNQTRIGEEAEVVLKKYPSLCVYYLCTFLMYKYDYEVGKLQPSKTFTVPDTLVFSMLEMAHDLIV